MEKEILEIPKDCVVPDNPGILTITPECLVSERSDRPEKVDVESGAALANAFFLVIAIACSGIFAYQVSEGLFGLSEPDPSNFTFRFANWGDRNNAVGIVTSIFLHGSVDHILGNLVFLYPLSLIVHRLFGSIGSLLAFIGTGILAGSATYFLSGEPSIGASGAVFGIFGIVTVFYVRFKDRLSDNLRDGAVVLPIVAGYQIFLGFTNPVVDNVAHVAGFSAGILFALAWFRKDRGYFDSPSKGM